jgi:hypothetical protein
MNAENLRKSTSETCTDRLATRKTKAGHVPELRKVRAHLVFVEAVRDPPEIYHASVSKL